MNRIAIIDCDMVCYMAKFRIPVNERNNRIVFGFLDRIRSLLTETGANKMVFAWDSRKPLRSAFYPPYKANRSKRFTSEEEIEQHKKDKGEFSIARRLLEEFGFGSVWHTEGYEADDLIAAALVACDSDEGRVFSPPRGYEEAIVVSRDKDLYQLLSNKVVLYDPVSRKRKDMRWFINEYGIPPVAWAVVKAITGCPTDNVQGAVGIAEKTAIKYLKGELSPASKMLVKILGSNRTTMRNKWLVRLPFRGTPKQIIGEDRLSLDKFVKVCEKEGLTDFLYGKQWRQWINFFKQIMEAGHEQEQQRF